MYRHVFENGNGTTAVYHPTDLLLEISPSLFQHVGNENRQSARITTTLLGRVVQV
jgi:hypothetical protein